jgi:hypothetical protein
MLWNSIIYIRLIKKSKIAPPVNLLIGFSVYQTLLDNKQTRLEGVLRTLKAKTSGTRGRCTVSEVAVLKSDNPWQRA